MIDYRERRLRFWCQKVLPLVYDESLSYYELLCKIMKHLSEAETDVSALEAWLAELDAEAVKKVYSEYPLVASKEGNVVTLNYRDTPKPVTGFGLPTIDNPITVNVSEGSVIGHLDPNDDESPEGIVGVNKTATIDITPATTSKRGTMSADDKTKIDRLVNTFVEAGDNIVVSSSVAANGDTTYTVGVDPNFQPAIQEWSLTGDEWEWNASLNGKMGSCYIVYTGTELTTQEFVTGLSGNPTSFGYTERMVTQGAILLKQLLSSYYSVGFTVGAYDTLPFATVTGAGTRPADGEVLYTTDNAIRIKAQLYGTGVANKEFTIYLGCNTQMSGVDGYSNTHAIYGDQFFPASGSPYIPAKYTVTTDANGYFDVTIPAGLEGISYYTETGAGGYTVPTRIDQIAIVASGDKMDLYGSVKIDTAKIAVKARLNAS